MAKWLEKFDELGISPYLLDEVPLRREAKTIQILMIRQTHDFSIFRTEETRELNTAVLPKSISDSSQVIRVVLLASKQKAPENRTYISLFRTFAKDLGVQLDDEVLKCTLKDNLCRMCPRCVLFGAVSTEQGRQGRWNIKHRIEYASAYSLEPYEDVAEYLVFNAVDSATQSTGQALGSTENVSPVVNFPSIVSLNSVTEEELIWYLKTLMATKSYGAETRIKGDVVNEVVGLVAGYEEIITSLEFMLELAACEGDVSKVGDILKKYKEMSAFPDKTLVLGAEEISELMDSVRKFSPTKDFIEALGKKAKKFHEEVSKEASPRR